MSGEHGRYRDGRQYELPRGWEPADQDLLGVALEHARVAVGVAPADMRTADRRVARYYDPGGGFAGNLHSLLEPNDPVDLTAADLLGVHTLSMALDPRQIRRLLLPHDARTQALRTLRAIPENLPLDHLGHAETGSALLLEQMWGLIDRFRTLLQGTSNRWVFAAKLAARKRPELFPVRDNEICCYLGGVPSLRGSKLGRFSTDIQVLGHIYSDQAVRDRLHGLRDHAAGRHGAQWVDSSLLRVLDVALWMTATGK